MCVCVCVSNLTNRSRGKHEGSPFNSNYAEA